MKLRKHSETFGSVTQDWFTIYVGEKQSTRFSLYSKNRMPDFVEVNWAPPVTDQKEPYRVEDPAVPVRSVPGLNPDLDATRKRKGTAPQAHVFFPADPPATAV